MPFGRTRAMIAWLSLASMALLALALPGLASAKGGYYPLWAAPHDGLTLTEPSDVAVGLDGTIYVADTRGGRVVAMTSSGTLLRAIDGEDAPGQELVDPVALDIGPDGRLYVADAAAGRVSVFEPDGDFVRSWTGASGGGALAGPSGLSVASDGTVYVSDTFNNVVKAYSATGQWIRTFGSSGSWGQLIAPGQLLVSGTDVFVADVVNRRIVVFNTAGTYLRKWGITDGGIENPSYSRYRRPSGMAPAPGGGLFVADGGTGFVEKCNTLGTVQSSWVTTTAVDGLAGIGVGSGGKLWLADEIASRIVGLDASGTLAPTLQIAGSSATSELRNPQGAAIDTDGNVYVADTGNSRVQMYGPDGRFLRTFEPAEESALDTPVAVAVSPDGLEVAVVDQGSDQVAIYSHDGRWLRWVGAELLTDPSAASIAEDGSIYIADAGGDCVVHLSAMGELRDVWGTGALDAPGGVAVGPSGRLYVSDTEHDRIVSFASSSSAAVEIATPGSAVGRVFEPRGIALEPGGDLLVADTGNGRIQRLTDTGAPVCVIGDLGSGLGEVKAPAGVSVNAGGRIAIADTGNHRVQSLLFDDEPPTTYVSGVPSEWSTGPVTIALSATDGVVGVASVHYRIGGGVETTYTGPFMVTAQGTTTVWVHSIDVFGNAETSKPATVRIDSLPPSGTVSWAESGSMIATTTAHLSAGLEGAVTMRVNAGDGWSPETPYSAVQVVQLPGEGVHHAAAEYLDWLGNKRTDAATITVDMTGPQVSFVGVPASGATSSTVMVQVVASDAPAGVESVQYSLNGSAFAPYTGPLTISVTGTHLVRARAKDALDNWSPIAEATVEVDKTPPSGSMLVGDGSTYVRDTAVTVRPSITGAARMNFTPGFAPGEWSAYEGLVEFSLPGQGVYPIRGLFRDAAGNMLSLTHTLTVDWTPPTSRAAGIPEDGPAAGEAYISIVASDTHAGIDRIEYTLDSSATQVYTGPLQIAEEGWHTLEWSAVDRGGNREATHSATFAVEGPVLIDTLFAGGAPMVDSPRISMDTSSATVSLMRTDYGAGPGAWIPFVSQSWVTVPDEGVYQLVAEYRTIYGSIASRHQNVIVDLARPRVSPMRLTPTTLTLQDNEWLYNITAIAQATDSVSGIDRHVWRHGSKRLPGTTEGVGVSMPARIRTSLTADVFDRVGHRRQTKATLVTGGSTLALTGGWGAPLRVSGSLTGISPGRHELLCYGPGDNGAWVLATTRPVTVTTSGANTIVRARPVLEPGVWRFVLKTVSSSTTYLGTPSAVVTVE